MPMTAEGVNAPQRALFTRLQRGFGRRQDLAHLLAELTTHYLKHKLLALPSCGAANQQSFLRARGALVTLPRAPSVENKSPSWDHCINLGEERDASRHIIPNKWECGFSLLHTAPVACSTSSSNSSWL